MKSLILISIILCANLNMISLAQDSGSALPPIAKVETVTEKHLGKTCKDPYRWMENPDDPALYGWLQAEELYTDTQTAGALRNQLSKEFTDIFTGKYASKTKTDSSVFQNLSEEQIFNRHRFDHKKDVSILKEKTSTSPSGRYEIVLEPKNTDINTLQIKDTTIDAYLKDVLTVKWPSIIWAGDEKSFY